MTPSIVFNHARVLTPEGLSPDRSLLLDQGRIFDILGSSDTLPRDPAVSVSLKDCTVLPGLINSHDHLVGTWTPKAGDGMYNNVYEWLDYYERHPVRLERMGIADVHIVALGGYRNLVSGVTTVVDHYFRLPEETYAGSPIRALIHFGREWVLPSYSDPDRWKSWGKGIEEELREADGKLPFIIHLSEGTDPTARAELKALADLGALRANTLIVHGVAMDDKDLEMVHKAGASVAWCPSSNHFLYGETLNVRNALEMGINVCIGTDSTVTGAENLLREMQYARKAYLEKYSVDLEPERILQMVTTHAAKALLIEDTTGTLARGKVADLLVVRDDGTDPFETLLSATPLDLDLVVHKGIPLFGKPEYRSLFEKVSPAFSTVKLWGAERLITGDPVSLVQGIFDQLGYPKKLDFFDIEL